MKLGPQFDFVIHRDNAWPYDDDAEEFANGGSTGGELAEAGNAEFLSMHPHVQHAVRDLTPSDVDYSFDVTAAVHRPSGRLAGTLITGALDQAGEVHMVETSPDFRRQGIATSLLRHAQSQGIPVKDDWRGSKSDEGRAFTEGLIRKGLIKDEDVNWG